MEIIKAFYYFKLLHNLKKLMLTKSQLIQKFELVNFRLKAVSKSDSR